MRLGAPSLLLLVLLTAAPPACAPSEASASPTLSYALGWQIGEDLAAQGREVDPDALRRGLQDGLAGAEPRLATPEMKALLLELKRSLTPAASGSQRTVQDEARFLRENAQRADVISLPSGLQYRVLEPGDGASPGPADQVRMRYRASLIDGRVFHDSASRGGPELVALETAIPGLREGLQRMREGARFEIFIPPQLAYPGGGPLEDRVVIFDVALVSVEPREQP